MKVEFFGVWVLFFFFFFPLRLVLFFVSDKTAICSTVALILPLVPPPITTDVDFAYKSMLLAFCT